MLNVKKYLQNHTLEDLKSNFGIIITHYPDRIVLNYNQIKSIKCHTLCDECRGLILDRQTLTPLSRSFDRFYNYGEIYLSNDQFDIQRADAAVKIDGSLINVYNDGLQWNCATRKMAFAEGQTTKGNTFKSVVEKALGFRIENLDGILPNEMKEYTLICELISPETRIVVPYQEYKIYLLAIRHKETGEYWSHEECKNIAYNFRVDYGLNITTPNIYTFKTFEECIKISKELEPMDYNGEGFVLVDNYTQNRIKIKNPTFIAIANLRANGAISNKRIAKLVFEQDHYEEYLQHFECDRQFFNPYIKAYEKLMKDINDYYKLYNNIKSQKKFALIVKDLPIAGILFALRKEQKLEEIFRKMNDNKKQELLDIYKK